MSELDDALASLTPDQRARLAARLRERRRASPAADGIVRRPDLDVHPLSPAQERIWRLSRLRPDDAVYNVAEAKRLRGPLDIEALRRGFAETVRRHESLRATFVNDGGAPSQDIAPPDHFAFDVVDVEDGIDGALDAARQELQRPVDLARGPVLRVRVLRLAADDHVLIVTTHHIVCDGWAMGVIEDEVSAVYRAVATGQPVDLEEPTLQYADVAHWQRERSGPDAQPGLDHWAQQLGPDVEQLRLPGDARRPSTRSTEGGHHAFELSGDLRSAIDDLSRSSRVTPFMVTMAAFMTLLHRHTGQSDMLVCAPVAGRDRRETERMVGYFNNLVVIRGDLSGDPSFAEVVRRLRPVMTQAFDHQHVPFQDVAAIPHLATTPLTRALFVLQDERNRALVLPDIDVETLDVAAGTADFDLGVFVRPHGDGLAGTVRFRTHLFDHAAIATLMEHYTDVLRAVVDDPTVRLSTLPSFADQGAAAPTGTVRGMERPGTAIESQLQTIWERLFRRSPVSIHDDFFELGGHSLLAAELAADIERDITGRQLPLATLFEAPTIARLAALIDNGDWSSSWSSLVPIKPTGTRPPLFFVHAHGGNVIGYHDLARRLGPDQPLYGLQSPQIGRDDVQVVEQHIPEMAKRYLGEIRDVQSTGPYHLGGWCLGGDVAFEMATQLVADGEDVATVIMVDNPRPSHVRASAAGPLASRAANRARTRLAMEWSNLMLTDAGARSAYARSRAAEVSRVVLVRAEERVGTALDAVSVDVPPSRALRQLRVAQAHEKAYARYDPPKYAGRVSLFVAERQPVGRTADPSLGWASLITGPLDIYEVPGHRVGMLSEPRVEGVAEQMLRAMDAADGTIQGRS
ncbi:hypothetical protein BH23ACT10_BH23ACT10_17680 [soil metagenome]